MLESQLSSDSPIPASRPELRGGNQYRLLSQDALELGMRLEKAALRSENCDERKKLRTLSAAALTISACLDGTGVKSDV
jgi:hypothetical protein